MSRATFFRDLTCIVLVISSFRGSAQVYDGTMISNLTTSGIGEPAYGPRNYMPGGTFNTAAFGQFGSFATCDEADVANWGTGSTHLSGYQLTPAPLFPALTNWPYNFKWICSFDEYFGAQHPANFYAGVIALDFYEVTFDGMERYNYMLFALKEPLTPGVEYVFQGKVAAGTFLPADEFLQVESIQFALLHDIPVPDSEYAFLDGVVPFTSTPPGTVVGTTPLLLNDTLIGNGERYLVVGLFTPIEELVTSAPITNSTNFEYVLEDMFLYRPHCNYATTSFWDPSDEACSTEPYEVELAYGYSTSPARQWWVNGVLQQDSIADHINVLYSGQDETHVMAITDTAACADTASFTVIWRSVEANLPDTFTFCGDPVSYLATDTILHNITTWDVQVIWEEITGNFYDITNAFEAELPDSGTYAVNIGYNGCVQRDTIVVGPDRTLVDTNLVGDPALQFEIGAEHCVNMNDGYVIVHDMGYPGELQFNWLAGPFAGVDTNSIAGLSSGNWQVRISDDQYRCSEVTAGIPQLLDQCAVIKGTVYQDLSMDCVNNEGLGRPLVTVRALPIGNVAVTDSSGKFELLVPPGAYTVDKINYDPLWGNYCGEDTAVVVPYAGSIAQEVNMGDTLHIPIHDLRLEYGSTTPWLTGGPTTINLRVRNVGEVAHTAIVRIHMDHPQLELNSAVIGAISADWEADTLVVDAGVLQQGAMHDLSFTCMIPADPALLNSVVHISARVEAVVEEEDLEDNQEEMEFPIVGAYDPNDKLVEPYGDPYFHSVDTNVRQLRYTIRFQNTGNWPATTVRLKDELSSLLVPQSLQVLQSSHPMQAFTYGQDLVFEFPSIMLPDSASDPEGSIGWVMFILDVVPDVQYGDTIKNVAEIYFDQNPPIITPPAITRYMPPIVLQMPMDEVTSNGNRFLLVPNPANSYTSIIDTGGGEPIRNIEIVALNGSRVIEISKKDNTLDLTDLAPGPYAVRLYTANGIQVLKLIRSPY